MGFEADRLEWSSREKPARWEIIEALMGMVGQHCRTSLHDEEVSHAFLSSNEDAFDVLVRLGTMDDCVYGNYILRYDKLEKIRPKKTERKRSENGAPFE